MIVRAIDWGAYVGYKGAIMIPWRQVIDYAGVRAFICKGCQEDIPNGYSTQLNLQASRAAGIEINGCYYWHYPTGSPSYWLDVYSKAIDLERPDFISVDIEQYWGEGGITVAPQQISDTAQALCEGLRYRYPGKQVVVYSRQNFPLQYAPMMDKWLPAFDCGWVASWPDYGKTTYRLTWEQIAAGMIRRFSDGALISLDTIEPANLLAWSDWKIWQYSSRILLPADVGMEFDHQYDWNIIKGSVEEIKAWTRKEEEPTMATRAYLIPPETCARAITITQEDARFGITGFSMKDLAVTTAIIRAGYSTSPGSWKETVDLAWIPHASGAIADKVPVTMWYELDPAWYRWNNVDENMVKDRSGHPDRQPVLLQILRCWYGDPAATWDQMKGAPAANWRAISAMMLSQFNTVYQSQDVGDFWFTLSISDIFDQLHALMEGAQIPTVPLILQISPALLIKYAGLLAWVTARAKWLYLAYGDTAYNKGAVWTLDTGHTDIPSLAECWPWTWFNIDPAKYVWFEPEGMHGRILFHETTKDRMYTPIFQTSGGVANRPVRLSLSPMLPEDLMKILIPSVTVPGDPTIEELKARIAELEALNTLLSAQHVADTATIGELNAQIVTIRKSWEDWWRPLSVLVGQAPVQ